MRELIGLTYKAAVKKLESEGLKAEIVNYDDFRLSSFDRELVIKAEESGDGVKLTVSKFLFSPKERKE